MLTSKLNVKVIRNTEILQKQQYLNLYFWFLAVIDDENPTEVTAGAIVTVTVTLIRQNMSTLFGDETVVEAQAITENGIEGDTKEGDGDNEQQEPAIKRPAWLKQKKG